MHSTSTVNITCDHRLLACLLACQGLQCRPAAPFAFLLSDIMNINRSLSACSHPASCFTLSIVANQTHGGCRLPEGFMVVHTRKLLHHSRLTPQSLWLKWSEQAGHWVSHQASQSMLQLLQCHHTACDEHHALNHIPEWSVTWHIWLHAANRHLD